MAARRVAPMNRSRWEEIHSERPQMPWMESVQIRTEMRFSRWVGQCAKCSINSASDLSQFLFADVDQHGFGMSQLKIHEMPKEERPREKLAAHGPSTLSNPELIAILLRTGIVGANAIEVARQLLEKYGSLGGLSRCSVDELAKVRGVGFAKAVQLVAAFGLGQRLPRGTFLRQKIDSPEIVNELVLAELRALRKESLRAILLDTRYHLIRIEQVSLGSGNYSIAQPREVFHPAVVSSAYAVIVVHNHPSGDASPSQADHSLTRRLADAAELLLINLLDHIIVGAPAEGNPGYFSFKEAGVL